MALLKDVSLNGGNYEIHYFTGAVVDDKTWSETKVSGSGGGGSGYSVGGTGVTNSGYMEISSTTTRHDQIILQNRDGKEKAFKFVDWDISCRKGNVLTVAWAIPKGKDSGYYILIYNHDSDEFYRNEEFAKMLMPGRITLPFLGHSTWWRFAAIPGAPLVWSIVGAILPIGILYAVVLILSPFFGYWGAGKVAMNKGEKSAREYLDSDPDKLISAIKETRQEAPDADRDV